MVSVDMATHVLGLMQPSLYLVLYMLNAWQGFGIDQTMQPL